MFSMIILKWKQEWHQLIQEAANHITLQSGGWVLRHVARKSHQRSADLMAADSQTSFRIKSVHWDLHGLLQ